MKEKYLDLIMHNGIQDTLHLIEELSYSRKLSIIKSLLKFSEPDIINRALNMYEGTHIKINRVNLNSIGGVLIGLCRRAKEAKVKELDKYKGVAQ